MRAWAAAPSTVLTTCSASRYSDCRDCCRSWAILVTSPYRPQRTAKALAMRCGIVDMGTHSVEADRGITPTIAYASTGIVHRIHRVRDRFEKVPSEDQRREALERFRILRPYLEEGVPLA